jgi:nucleoside-diphosphate-sugar epimerase
MARLLVIGGSGFFGKSILDSYQRGLLKPFGIDAISVLARNAHILKAQAPDLLDQSISLIDENIATCTMLPEAEFVIHAAASTDVKNYIKQPAIERENIQAGTLNFCRLAPIFCRNSNVVFVSSGAVYGQQPVGLDGFREDSRLIELDSLVTSKQDYAAAKRHGENVISLLGEEGLKVSIARCFAFVGKYLPRDRSFAIGNFMENGLQGKSIAVNTRGLVYRSYLYADDLVQWLMRIGGVASVDCPIFNVGSDESISIQDLAKKFATYFEVDLLLPEIEIETIDRYIPSIEKARSIDCHINYPLDKAIEITIASLLKR